MTIRSTPRYSYLFPCLITTRADHRQRVPAPSRSRRRPSSSRTAAVPARTASLLLSTDGSTTCVGVGITTSAPCAHRLRLPDLGLFPSGYSCRAMERVRGYCPGAVCLSGRSPTEAALSPRPRVVPSAGPVVRAVVTCFVMIGVRVIHKRWISRGGSLRVYLRP